MVMSGCNACLVTVDLETAIFVACNKLDWAPPMQEQPPWKTGTRMTMMRCLSARVLCAWNELNQICVVKRKKNSAAVEMHSQMNCSQIETEVGSKLGYDFDYLDEMLLQTTHFENELIMQLSYQMFHSDFDDESVLTNHLHS